MKIAALCDEDTAIGFRLAGVHEVYVPENNARELFSEVTGRDDIGVLFITENIADLIAREIKEYLLQQRNFPIVVEIPGKAEGKPEHMDHISLLIKRAVGVDIERKVL
ncbi:MAG TPA: V-type ATP synthase subunit F [Thermoplasmatales archaeon]|nr:V-type ATP synthase subunit F [Thermoplasmatales archaeon]